MTAIPATKKRKQLADAPRTRKPRGLGHERRQEILAAAKELFIAEGYETVTTRALAARVGISQTGLYVYFKNKEEILDALCQATFATLTERTRKLEARWRDSPTLLRRLIEGYVEFGLENPDEYKLTFMVGHVLLRRSHGKDLNRPFEEQGTGMQAFLVFRDQIARMTKQGLLNPKDITIASQIVWAAIHGLVALFIARSDFPWWGSRQQLINSLVDTLTAGLQNTPRAK